jgi:hypothetical protein
MSMGTAGTLGEGWIVGQPYSGSRQCASLAPLRHARQE